MSPLKILIVSILALWPFGAHALDEIVQKQVFSLPSYTTAGGKTIKDVKIGYETYGTLNAAKDNVIVVPHFFSGNSHVAGKYKADDKVSGYWDAITGPGRPLDTSKYFIIGVDSLCNLNTKDGVTVTTGPASINPDTGKPYAMNFPVVQMRDFVNLQKALVESLGIKKLHAVMGLSMGGIQSWEWAAAYPDMVERMVGVVSSPVAGPYTIETVQQWADAVMMDPKWNHGDYYGKEEPIDGLTLAYELINLQARQPDWADATFGRKPADPAKDPASAFDNQFAVEKWFVEGSRARAKATDANNLICLVRANVLFQAGDKPTLEEGLAAIKAKVLLLPDHRDLLLFPEYSRQARDILEKHGKHVEYHELEGANGHLDSITSIAQVGPTIQRFLEEP
ncbi:MAG TPA: homoserine O-acetyltransferase [Stellaceae bacterium]|nr:homoserine O-acetyltransferase [Stellaceae bacterium]